MSDKQQAPPGVGEPDVGDPPAGGPDVMGRGPAQREPGRSGPIGFSAATSAWFTGAFHEPTPAQRGAWSAIGSGRHTLVVAPTGSGKTLAAFLWALDRLLTSPPPQTARRCRVLYISPLKALGVDVERNLRSPLVGIGHAAARLGVAVEPVVVGVRSGDTPAPQRRALAKTPPDILITTPESLYLMLTSAARETLAGVETVILDEVHAVAGSKRGAHLALSLERLDALLPQPAQRIGLSATVRPIDEVARFLAGGRPVEVVAPPADKHWELQVRVPVPDLGALGQPTGDLSGPAAGEPARSSIWPHVEEHLVDLVAAHRATLVFANSRRLAERLTNRLNEIWAERLEEAAPRHTEAVPAPRHTQVPGGLPAQIIAQSGVARGAPAILARAHHGSVSKESRALVEEELKAGRLPAVVATSSLELGIDMGAIDLVVQVESPPTVASGLQRVGRAGHQVGAVSRGVFFPKFRGDLVQTAVVVERMRAGQIEALRVPANPLDVLAQQIVAMCALDDWAVDELERLVRRAAPFAGLSRLVLESVLDMLSGRYPSDEFAELRPRLVWDRLTGTLSGRRGAQRLAVTSGGTIPDRGLYAVFLAGGDGPGRRVGELDEEMVYESRVGDVFTLGTSTWRIEDITHDRVLVTPAPGQAARLPFWKGDTIGRPPELGEAVGAFVREVTALDASRARERVQRAGLDEWATDNLLAYLQEQREAIRQLPTDRTLVVERFRDELGDWRIVVHSPYGAQVHAPWALAVAARMRERFGVDIQAMHADDGLVFRLPDLELDSHDRSAGNGSDGHSGDGDLDALIVELVLPDPEEIGQLVTAQVGGSALFAGRFRECAARALLLPRRRPDRRQPLWQQRQRSAALLEVASRYPAFPIVLEAVRECLQDVFDVPGLVQLLARVRAREVGVVSVQTATPSPFARSLLFGYVAQYLYEGDSPLAERRAAALTLDPTLLAELLGGAEGLSLRDLLDPQAIARTEVELQRLTPSRAARDVEDLADVVRMLGPLTLDELVARVRDADAAVVGTWVQQLQDARRIIGVRIGGALRWAAVEDAGRLRDALGVGLPVGVPETFLALHADPMGDLVARYARGHGPFTPAEAAAWLGVGPAPVRDALRRLVGAGRVVEGELRPTGVAAVADGGLDYCDSAVLRLIRRRSVAALRAEIEPVAPIELARFIPAWQGVGSGWHGTDAVLRVVEQLSGAILPASAVETLVLPARVRDYHPAQLDELLAAGEVIWRGHGALAGDDGWVSLHVADGAPLTLGPPLQREQGPVHAAVLDLLAGGGGHFFVDIARAVSQRVIEPATERQLRDALWELTWSGQVTGDTFAPLRGRLVGGRTSHRARTQPTPRGRYAAGRRRFAGLAANPTAHPGAAEDLRRRGIPADVVGRWSLTPAIVTDPTTSAVAAAEVLLDRYGVLTRGSVTAEDVPGGFARIYRVLADAEAAGRVRRGYFVEGLGAAQFASTGAVDRLRGGAAADQRPGSAGTALVLAAADPSNPYGAALPWPSRPASPGSAAQPAPARGAQSSENEAGKVGAAGRGHQPGRKAGALVVLIDGALVLYVERGGRTLLTWSEQPESLGPAAQSLAAAVRSGALGRLTVERSDGTPVLGSTHPLVAALADAGFHWTPRGLRLRR